MCTCIDKNLPARLLAERCDVTVTRVTEGKLEVKFSCVHGRSRGHSVFAGNTRDFEFFSRLLADSGAVANPEAA
jgi:hypothetical protein